MIKTLRINNIIPANRNHPWIHYNVMVKIIRSITNETNRTVHQTSSNGSKTFKHSDKVSAIPHPISKLRLFNYAINENETEYEKRLRERRIQIQNFNHEYWSKINTEFNQVVYLFDRLIITNILIGFFFSHRKRRIILKMN